MSQSHHPRRILTPVASRKRKEREPLLYSLKTSPRPPSTTSSVPTEPLSSKWLLAGYMAHEFLAKGTLFGQTFDPARAAAMQLASGASAESRGHKPGQGQRTESEPNLNLKPAQSKSYAEVAALMKSDGAHIPGVVNPTQLARWIRM